MLILSRNMLGCLEYRAIIMIAIIGVYLMNVLMIAKAQIAVRTRCLPGDDKCYTLYRADRTWQRAYDSCLSRNQHLATIQDVQTHSIMLQFATEQVFPEGAAHAWVAGRRSDDTAWRHTDGRVFNYTGSISDEGDSSRLCMLLNGQSGLAADANLHLAVPCYNPTAYKAVCEYDPLGAVCPDDDRTIHQTSVHKCNTVSRERYQSGQDARQYCQSQSWELAHTGAGMFDFYSKLTLTDKPLIADEPALWIGIQRKPWIWKLDAVHSEYMTTTYWRHQEGVNSGENCMHIGLNDRGLWADKTCDITSTYFICQNYTDHQITTRNSTIVSQKSTTATSPSLTSTVMESPPDDGVTSDMMPSQTKAFENQGCSTDCHDGGSVTWYAIIGVITCLFVIENVILAILCFKRKQFKLFDNRKLNMQEPTIGPDYVNVSGDGVSKYNNNAESTSGMNAAHVADYEEPDNLVTDEYITTTDGTTVPGHSQNEAYVSLEGQTRETPGPNVYDVVDKKRGRSYENV